MTAARKTGMRSMAGVAPRALRCGIDLVDVERFRRLVEQRGEALTHTVFTERERIECDGRSESLAARFAAKEAAAKALGCGIGRVSWREIETTNDIAGAPRLRLSGRAATRARELGLGTWTLSLSHSCGVAAALVIAAS
jgi:holo-[acyl-carrier protein] synthase